MSRSKVAVLSTTPETVREDFQRLLRLLEIERVVSRTEQLRVLPDLCQTRFHPSTGSTPWQLDGVLSALSAMRVPTSRIRVVARDAPHVVASRALDSHGLGSVLRRHGLDVEYVRESADFLPPGSISEEPLSPEILRGVSIPAEAKGSGLILLPSLRTRPGPWIGGAIANWARWVWPQLPPLGADRWSVCMAQLAKLLREISPFVLTVVDGTLSGDGAGPRTNHPTVQNVLMASLDPVAIDVVGARLMGLDPRSIEAFRLCDRLGAGRGDLAQIEIVGESIEKINFGFRASRSISNIADGPLPNRWADGVLRGRVGAWLASLYEQMWWRPVIARRERQIFRRSPWGLLFEDYGSGGSSV